MKRNSIRLIVFLATILFVGLVVTQIFWVRKAYSLQINQLDYDITQSLKDVAQQILIHNSDSAQLYDPVEHVSDNVFRVRIQESIEPDYLESILTNEFRNEEINMEYEYSIYDCFNDSVVFSRLVSSSIDSAALASVNPEFDWQTDAHYFGVFFPDKSRTAVSGLSFWFLSSSLLLVIVVFFTYIIMVILRQKRLSEIKNDFINNMTHELKTPISTISLSSKTLLRDDIVDNPEKLRSYANIINNENERLHRQVEKVLQMATLEKEKIHLNKRALDLHEIISECLQVFDLTIQDKQGKVNVDLNAVKSNILGDDVHITNIIYNLIDNAIKYSSDAPVISLKSENEGKKIKISISDKGIGLSPEVRKHIFEKFYREPTGNVHDVKGFGLGLYYVKNMMKAHNATVSCESIKGEGSTFTLIFQSYDG